MSSATISIMAKGAEQLAKRLARSAVELRAASMRGVEIIAREAERDLKRNRLHGNPIHMRSGVLNASVHTQLYPQKVEARVGSPTHYAPALEEGATIKPKNARVLTIPLAAARTAAGKSRGNARQVGAMYDHTFWKKSKRGALILWGSRDGKLTPLFVGKKRVRIPAKRPFALTARKVGAGGVAVMGREIGKVLR